MPGERRLTSIKQLVSDMMFNANLTGTITIDEITNTVTVQLVEPVTVDGTINIGTMPAITIQDIVNLNVDSLPAITIASMPSITIADIVNLNIDSIPTITFTYAIGNIQYTSGVVSVTSADTLIVPANANRKFLMLQRGTTAGRVFCKFGASAATTTNGFLMRENVIFTFEKEYIDTREVRGISVGSNKIVYWTEGV